LVTQPNVVTHDYCPAVHRKAKIVPFALGLQDKSQRFNSRGIERASLTWACTHKIATGNRDLINVGFGLLSRLKSDIARGPKSAPLTALQQIISSWAVRNYYLFALDLNRNAVVIGGARNDHQVATWDLVLTPHHLADRSDGIHDGRTRRVGHETLQWFQNASARRLTRKRKQIWLPRLEPSDRGL